MPTKDDLKFIRKYGQQHWIIMGESVDKGYMVVRKKKYIWVLANLICRKKINRRTWERWRKRLFLS